MKRLKKNLRILLISSDKYPVFRPALYAIFNREMANRGHIVDCLLQAEKYIPKAYTVPFGKGQAYVGATDEGETRLRRLHKYALDFINDLRIFKLMTINEYDVMQVKDKYVSALLAFILARFKKKRFFFWLAYPHPEANIYAAKQGVARYRIFYFLRGYFYKFILYKIILRLADHVFVQSEQMKQDIAAQGILLEKMTPVPGSVDVSAIPFDAPNPDYKILKSAGEKWILYLGTFIRERNLDFLIRVLGEVLRQIPRAKLYMLGKGEMPEDEKSLKDEAKRLGIEDAVIFTGHLPMKKAWEYIRKADVCASPYYPTPILNSTSPTKLIEYMAMGKPVVGNDHPEQSLVIKESGAGIVTSWNEKEFASAIIKILKDPEAACNMGARGRRYVEMYRTNEIITDSVLSEYYRLLE